MTLAVPVAVDFSPQGIRALREGLGLNVPEFAALLDVARQTVYSWEAGRQTPYQHYCRERLREAQHELDRRRR